MNWLIKQKTGDLPLARLTRIETAALTREKLLRAGRDVFSRKSFAEASIEEIADTAGFSRGAFYSHFSSKESLLLAIVESQSNEITPMFLDRLAQVTSPTEAIEVVLELFGNHGNSHRLAIAVMGVFADTPKTADHLRYTEVLTANWHRIGEAIQQFFPETRWECGPDELVAILVSLTYNPVVSSMPYDTTRLAGLILRVMTGSTVVKTNQ